MTIERGKPSSSRYILEVTYKLKRLYREEGKRTSKKRMPFCNEVDKDKFTIHSRDCNMNAENRNVADLDMW